MSRFGNPDFSFLESVDDHHSVGKRLLQQGKSFTDVYRHIAEAGVRDHNIQSILSGLATDVAKGWLAEGLSESQAIQRLVDRGLSVEEAYDAVDKSVQKKARLDQPSRRYYLNDWQYVVGFVLVLVGAFLWGGNRFGFFPTISGAGFFTMLFGASLAGYWYYQENT